MKFVLILIAAVIFAGCAPSVRYTRDKKSQAGLRERQRARRDQPPPQPPPPPPQQSYQPAAQPVAQAEAQESVVPPPRAEVPQDHTRYAPPRTLESVANSYLGTPYKYGGSNRKGLDCSGFVTIVFREVYNKKLPRSSAKMFKEGKPISPSAARPGDLIFFRNRRGGPIDHVGIYMGKKRFIHSSTSKGVIYSNMDEKYYSKRFAGMRRVI